MFIKTVNVNNSRAGFTLVELLVVIAVVGTLSAIAVPQFQSYKIGSYNAAALKDLEQFRDASINESIDRQNENNVLLVRIVAAPGSHPDFTAMAVSSNVRVFTFWVKMNAMQYSYIATCHTNGDEGYFMSVPLASNDILGAWYNANQIYEGAVWRAFAGC